MKTHQRRILKWLLRAALIVAVCLVLIEIPLRIAGRHYQAKFWDDAASFPAAERATVLTLGESTTAGLWLPVEESYPKQLESRLRTHYETKRVRVVKPPHIGQNTSQMLARFSRYMETFEPSVVVFMAGVNNSWSLAESNLGQFMPTGDPRTGLFRLRRQLDDVKVFRLARLLISGTGEKWRSMQDDLSGRPHMTQWPPPNDPLVRGIGTEPFMRLWRSDIGQMIEQAKAAGASVILMTYPNYDTPPISEFEAMAELHSVPLVENHEHFAKLIVEGRAEEFFFEDMRHPNKEGYAIVADNVFQTLMATGMLDDRVQAVRLPR